MSKSKKTFEHEWNEEMDSREIEDNRLKRKNKRLVNLLRSKNITDILRLEEDGED